MIMIGIHLFLLRRMLDEVGLQVLPDTSFTRHIPYLGVDSRANGFGPGRIHER
jgi:hypothetical protein